MKKHGFTLSLLNVIKSMFRRPNKCRVADTYLSCCDSIWELIEKDLIGVNLERRFVVLDSSVHLLFFENDEKYAAFFDKIRAYMNIALGIMGRGEMIGIEDAIDFNVVMKRVVYMDEYGMIPDDGVKTHIDTILVGRYCNAKVNYVPYTPLEEGSSEGNGCTS